MRWSMKRTVTLVFLVCLCLLFTCVQHTNWTERFAQVASSFCVADQTTAFRNDAHAQTNPENVIKLPFDDDSSYSGPKVKLLIVSYMRSGSSFTGAVFDQNPAAMYVFEPLFFLSKGFPPQSSASMPMFWDKKDINPEVKTEVENLRDTVLTGYLNCRFKDVLLQALISEFQANSAKTLLFKNCLRDHPGLLGILLCLPPLQQACRQSKAVVIKTIRYSMQHAERLMITDPRVKVLHLVRDPRAVILSQARLGIPAFYGVRNYTQMFCDRILRDLWVGDTMAQTFPGRVIRLRYEDLALRPFPYAEKLLQFAGLHMSPEEVKELEKITSTDLMKEYLQKFVFRTNSSVKFSQWRESAHSKVASLVDSYCKEVYSLAGYVPFNSSEMLRDARIPLMLPVSQVPRFLD